MISASPYPRANPPRTFHLFVLAYVLLLCMAAAANSGLVKAAANALAIALFVVTGVNYLFLTHKPRIAPGIALSLCIFYTGMLGSLCFSAQDPEVIDTLKIALSPIFVLFGAAFERPHTPWTLDRFAPRMAWGLLVVAPLLAWAVQWATGATAWGGGREVGIFANRNNAGLYAITLLAFYAVLRRKMVATPWAYLGVGLMFGTLGLLLAVMTALVVSHGKWRILVLAGSAATLALVLVTRFPELSQSLRVQPVVDSMVLLYTGKIDLATVSYAELLRRLGTSDLSFLFRLKHWYNLAHLFGAAGPIEWCFGFGAGASVRLSDIHLVPHNDYVRLLFEFGALTLLGFLALLLSTLRAIGRGWAAVPFVTVALYFGSENLINNYIAMVLFFYCAGAMGARAVASTAPNTNQKRLA